MTARGNCALNALVGTVPGVLLQAREPDTFLKIIKVSPRKPGHRKGRRTNPRRDGLPSPGAEPQEKEGRCPGPANSPEKTVLAWDEKTSPRGYCLLRKSACLCRLYHDAVIITWLLAPGSGSSIGENEFSKLRLRFQKGVLKYGYASEKHHVEMYFIPFP